jgi:ribosome-associated protein
MIEVTSQVYIPEEELRFAASRSSGPGGQNVNKLNTRVTLWFDVVNSPSLTDDQKRMLIARLGRRVSGKGVLRLVSQRSRSQAANREAVLERFVHLLRDALRPERPRRKTRIPQGAKERRLRQKVHRGVLKRQRAAPWPDDE